MMPVDGRMRGFTARPIRRNRELWPLLVNPCVRSSLPIAWHQAKNTYDA